MSTAIAVFWTYLVDRVSRRALKTKGVKLNTLEKLSLHRAPVYALGKKLYIMDFDWDYRCN